MNTATHQQAQRICGTLGVYVRLIPPGAADTVHYRLKVPPDARGKIQLRAKVNYRKFAWWNTQWAYAGVRDPVSVALLSWPRA